MATTKIEWCDWTWNPVWGCLRGCPYCYAHGIARRFAAEIHRKNPTVPEERIRSFVPTLIPSRLDAPFPKFARRIFVNSMSDPQYWNKEWLDKIGKRIRANPLKDFLFLTKEPPVYSEPNFPTDRNILRGVTDTGDGKHFSSCVDFVSAEPLHGPVFVWKYPRLRWIIIGAETGNRKGKIEPQLEWVEGLLAAADKKRIPVFFKESMRRYCAEWGIPFRQEFY